MLTIYDAVDQGSEEWFAARCGVLTASEMKKVITSKTLSFANNDKCRQHVYELAAQRITGYVEPMYVSDDMIRGHFDEDLAKELYNENYAEVREVGFITNDKFGFTLGFSPDGLVGDDGLIEIKSRRQKYQAEIIMNMKVDVEHMIQVQTGMLVSERKWCDYISYCGGMPMVTIRVMPDEKIQSAIIDAARHFHAQVADKIFTYEKRLKDKNIRLIETERFTDEISGSDEEIAA